MAEPLRGIAGDTWTWTRSGGDYPATDGWTLKYFFAQAEEAPQQVDATADGADFAITIPASTTAGWNAGTYHWTARVSKAGEVYTLGTGTLLVDPDPSTPSDRRTHAEKALAAVEAVLERRMGDSIVEYEIDGVKAKHLPHEQLVKLRAMYRAQVRRERGGPPCRVIPVRFGYV